MVLCTLFAVYATAQEPQMQLSNINDSLEIAGKKLELGFSEKDSLLSIKESPLNELQKNNSQFLKDFYDLSVLLLEIKEEPTQTKFDAAKIKIDNLKSDLQSQKDSLSEDIMLYYNGIVEFFDKYRKDLYALFIFSN